jgi:hypothetical protein
MFSSFKEINMDWNNLVGNFNDFALNPSLALLPIFLYLCIFDFRCKTYNNFDNE